MHVMKNPMSSKAMIDSTVWAKPPWKIHLYPFVRGMAANVMILHEYFRGVRWRMPRSWCGLVKGNPSKNDCEISVR